MAISILTISLDEALKVAQAARAHAAEKYGRPIAVTVVGTDGQVVVQLNDPDTKLGSRAVVASAKALTAISFQKPAYKWGDFDPGKMGAQYTGVLGGAIIREDGDGVMIGAIGVSGLSAAEDQVVADFAARALTPES